MYQFNSNYRLFFKKRTDTAGLPISSPTLKVRSFMLDRDALTKTSSSFEVLEVPLAVENGDIVGMYDSFGTIHFLGIVEYVDGNTIEATQIVELFDDDWLWNNPRKSTLESTLKTILQNDFQNTRDTLLNTTFGVFDLETISNTTQVLQSQESRYVTNFASFIYDLFEKYGIQFIFDIPFSASTPKISIGIPQYDKLVLGNNTMIFRNFSVVTNVFETNKLVLYGEENGEYRGTWYATTTGITDNPSALNRIQQIKTNIVFSDDAESIVKASNLRNQIYNHEISFDMVLDNKLLKFEDLHLGQEADIYIDGDFYSTILTGYRYQMTNLVTDGTVNLRFGLVRTALTSKLFKRLANGS